MSVRICCSIQWSWCPRSSRRAAPVAVVVLFCVLPISCARPLRGTATIVGVSNAPVAAARALTAAAPPVQPKPAATSRHNQPSALANVRRDAAAAVSMVGTSGSSNDRTGGHATDAAEVTDSTTPTTGISEAPRPKLVITARPLTAAEKSTARRPDPRSHRHLLYTALIAGAVLTVVLVGRWF
jgi:hypothetical protein